MIESTIYDNGVIGRLFCNEIVSVPIELQRVHEARVIWVNHDALSDDPRFAQRVDKNVSAEEYFIDLCAFTIADQPEPEERECVTGYADRYGGNGIGNNGGSGRSAIVNGYYVKGIGRTPLVGVDTDLAHASGGAYLEECLREALFSEIIRRKFPRSAVPTLAVIDINRTVTWSTSAGDKSERRVLLVRPVFIRPAHFQRAVTYAGHLPKEGTRDDLRVRQMFERSVEIFGGSELTHSFAEFPFKWIEQDTYGFINRLRPGAYTTSNIGIDGKLVDFGATSGVPSWENIIYMLSEQPLSENLSYIAIASKDIDFYCRKHLGFGRSYNTNALLPSSRSLEYFQRRELTMQMLRFMCVPSPQMDFILSNEIILSEISEATYELIAHYQQNTFDIYDTGETPDYSWDIGCLGKNILGRHLKRMDSILRAILGKSFANAIETVRSRAAPSLFLSRDRLKKEIYEKFDGPSLDLDQVDSFIESSVAETCALLP